MSFITTNRMLRNGLINFYRNLWLSLAATLVLTVTLILLEVLVGMFYVTRFSVEVIESRVDVSIYMKREAPEKDILLVREDLVKNPLVDSVTYLSAAEALADFKARHQADSELYASLGELDENPLPATLQVKAKELKDYPELIKQIEDNPAQKNMIDKINYEDNSKVINRLEQFLNFLIKGGGVTAGVFALIAILVIFNTITLTIYNRREEVEIMRLVGATNWFIRGPFFIEAFVYSCIATIISAGVWIPIYQKLIPRIGDFLGDRNGLLAIAEISPIGMIGLLFLVALAITLTSTTLAMRKSLKT